MGLELLKYGVRSSEAEELYMTVAAPEMAQPADFAAEAFSQIKEQLAPQDARILQERVFGTAEGLRLACKVRADIYGRFDDGVTPSCLICGQGDSGIIAGIQVHAIRTKQTIEPVLVDGVPRGRAVRGNESLFLTLSDVSDNGSPKATDQAEAMLVKAQALLEQYGGGITSVPRAWMWLGDILSWYDDFNHVRNDFFTRVGAIGNGKLSRMPASTGIGLRPANGCQCSMDLAAVIGSDLKIDYLQTTEKQESAFEYGSAFSRAASAPTPAGRTVYVSGTASIDSSGATTNLNDPEGQIRETIENVRTALRDMDCTDSDIVQLTAYCKCKKTEEIFNSFPESKSWPALTVICDICRPDLLFEIEATAMKQQP